LVAQQVEAMLLAWSAAVKPLVEPVAAGLAVPTAMAVLVVLAAVSWQSFVQTVVLA
jgi:hypothetical protein